MHARVKNYYDRFNKVHSSAADGKKKKIGGGGRRGGHEGRGIFESVNNNNIIYEETPKLESEKTSSSKPIETGQNALGNGGKL